MYSYTVQTGKPAFAKRQVKSNISIFKNFTVNRQQVKEQLLDTIKPLQRGVAASDEDKQEVEKLCKQLEKVNPNKRSLSAPQVNGRWKLLYTTSEGILKTKSLPFLRPFGTIYQTIDTVNLAAKNQETLPFFNSVTAKLEPTSASATNVQFKTFRIFGIIPIQAPETARGAVDITYLDDDIRVTRGDKGSLFVLEMVERDVEVKL